MPRDAEASDEETTKTAAPPQVKVVPKKSTKWEGEDKDDDEPAVCRCPWALLPAYLISHIYSAERLGRIFRGRREATNIGGSASQEEGHHKGKDCGKRGAEGGKGE